MILWEKIALVGGILFLCGLLILFDDFFKPIQFSVVSSTSELTSANRTSVASISSFFKNLKRAFSNTDSFPDDERKEILDDLAFYQAETARLRRQLLKVGEIEETPTLVPLPAKIVSYDPIGASQVLTLNVGDADGVKEGMVVCSGNAIVGRVYKTSPNVSLAITCFHRLFKIPVRISPKPQEKSDIPDVIVRGMAVGLGSGIEVRFVSSQHSIGIGDIIYSSAEADFIPPNFLIGTVGRANSDASTKLWDIRIDPSSNSIELDSLYIPLGFAESDKMHIPKAVR